MILMSSLPCAVCMPGATSHLGQGAAENLLRSAGSGERTPWRVSITTNSSRAFLSAGDGEVDCADNSPGRVTRLRRLSDNNCAPARKDMTYLQKKSVTARREQILNTR